MRTYYKVTLKNSGCILKVADGEVTAENLELHIKSESVVQAYTKMSQKINKLNELLNANFIVYDIRSIKF